MYYVLFVRFGVYLLFRLFGFLFYVLVGMWNLKKNQMRRRRRRRRREWNFYFIFIKFHEIIKRRRHLYDIHLYLDREIHQIIRYIPRDDIEKCVPVLFSILHFLLNYWFCLDENLSICSAQFKLSIHDRNMKCFVFE